MILICDSNNSVVLQIAQAEEIAKQLKEVVTHLQEIVQGIVKYT